MLRSIDPGLNGLAWCDAQNRRFESGNVVSLKGTYQQQAMQAVRAMGDFGPTEIAIEEMCYYPQRSSAKSTRETIEILKLQAVGNLIAGYFRCPVHHYPARAWMGGSLPHHIVQARVLGALDEYELLRFRECLARIPKSLQHNLYDAAGILLRHLGRFPC